MRSDSKTHLTRRQLINSRFPSSSVVSLARATRTLVAVGLVDITGSSGTTTALVTRLRSIIDAWRIPARAGSLRRLIAQSAGAWSQDLHARFGGADLFPHSGHHRMFAGARLASASANGRTLRLDALAVRWSRNRCASMSDGVSSGWGRSPIDAFRPEARRRSDSRPTLR